MAPEDGIIPTRKSGPATVHLLGRARRAVEAEPHALVGAAGRTVCVIAGLRGEGKSSLARTLLQDEKFQKTWKTQIPMKKQEDNECAFIKLDREWKPTAFNSRRDMENVKKSLCIVTLKLTLERPWHEAAFDEKCAATCGHHVIKCPCAVSSNNGVTTIRAGDQQIGICGIITSQFQPSLLVPSHHSPTFHSP